MKRVMMAAACSALVAVRAQEDKHAELARKLANPVASLVSVPFQYNHDDKFGIHDDGDKSVLNMQPVVPFSLSDNWNLITRTIVPLVDAKNVPTGLDKSGLGDITQSFFFSPKQPVGGWILAVGPAGYYPTASDDALGGEKWGVGPTALALRQTGPWTCGLLANHIESVAGDDARDDIRTTFVQPFLSYITKTKTTIGLNTESAYDWESDKSSVPINASVSQLFKIGPQIMQFSLGSRYWADSPVAGPDGWGMRVQLTFLFPR